MTKDELKIFLESGIIERYVIGDVTREEEATLLDLAGKHEEVAQALKQSEQLIYKIVKSSEVEMPASLSDKIFDQIKPSTGLNFLKVSGILLSILSIMLLVYAIRTQSLLNESEQELEELQIKCTEASNDFAGLKDAFQLIADPATQRIVLNQTSDPGLNAGLVWYNSTNGMALFTTNNLSELDEDFDYQMWAIVDGIPNSIGIIEMDENNQIIRVGLPEIPSAFAISIEPKGGSESPTVDRIIALGVL